MKGIRHFFRNFTALAVKEHLRSQIEDAGNQAELTPKEVELVRFATERSDQLSALANDIIFCPIASLGAQRLSDATQSSAVTGRPSWNLRPSRRVKV